MLCWQCGTRCRRGIRAELHGRLCAALLLSCKAGKSCGQDSSTRHSRSQEL